MFSCFHGEGFLLESGKSAGNGRSCGVDDHADVNQGSLSKDEKKPVVCGIFSKKKDHGICGLYHQTTTPGGVCHGQEEFYRIGV